jgi:hypothetical protein
MEQMTCGAGAWCLDDHSLRYTCCISCASILSFFAVGAGSVSSLHSPLLSGEKQQ